jgi:hypothetical protein
MPKVSKKAGAGQAEETNGEDAKQSSKKIRCNTIAGKKSRKGL